VLVVVAVAVTAGATAVRRHGGREPPPAPSAGTAAPAGRTAPPAADGMREVAILAGRHDPGAVGELVALYGKLAGVPGSIEARQAAVRSLLAHPNVIVGLQAVLAAVAGDPTAPPQDPLWPHLVQSVAAQWDAVTVAHGRDLLALETRPKPRDLLLESLAAVAPQRLTDEQRAALVSDLIDLYPSLRPEQKPAVERALTALGSSDLVEILRGRGLGEGSNLRAAVEERAALEATSRSLHVPTGAQP
jgi:hypothetical protein